jgi:hypothetical protein
MSGVIYCWFIFMFCLSSFEILLAFSADDAVTETDVHSKFENLTGRTPSSAQTSDVREYNLNL